jgi:hypothetical protein
MNALDFFHLEGTGRLPTIYKHTDAQLTVAIERAAEQCPDFFVLLHGIDAYMERRRRKVRAARQHRETRRAEQAAADWNEIEAQENMWGRA